MWMKNICNFVILVKFSEMQNKDIDHLPFWEKFVDC